MHPTFIITTYTGDDCHSVIVGVLGVPAEEESWSPRLRVYFKAISQFHARPKETPLGMLMVTNLSSFPSALTVIPVPGGDVRMHREDFIVNENLKRLGCSGRAGMSLSSPAGATQAKFLQLYKTSDRIQLYGAVIELVKLCQVALMIFGKLEQEYADGMLCDVTEKAVNDWWTEIGSEYYNVEPTDGILGPTTVAALLGMLMGSRNRLNHIGAPVAKDAFDVFALKRGIAYFQKVQKIPRTRRLDHPTLERLRRVTAKAAAGEGWAVPKAVKSTVAELSGKSGEMMMGMVGRSDKAGIGDVETLDLDQFVELTHGERAKWLWHGKPKRTDTHERSEHIGGNYTFTKDDQGGYIWSHGRSESSPPEEDLEARRKKEDSPQPSIYSAKPSGSATSVLESPNEKERELRKTVFKSVTGKMSDARSGFGRIKDAVGLRGHISRPSKDEVYGSEGVVEGSVGENSSTTLAGASPAPTSPTMISKTFTWKNTPAEYQNGAPKEAPAPAPALPKAQNAVPLDVPLIKEPSRSPPVADAEENAEADAKWAAQVREIRRELLPSDASVGGSTNGDDPELPVLDAGDLNNPRTFLRRRHSISDLIPSNARRPNEARWPRQLSFADVEDVVLSWEPIGAIVDDGDESDTWPALRTQLLIADDSKRLFEKITCLQDEIAPWVEKKVDDIGTLEEQAARDQHSLQTLYSQMAEQQRALEQNAQDLVGDERAHLVDAIKDIEVFGAKLEYEINALVSKVQDVEDGVSQYEALVIDLEQRALDLETTLRKESWPHWIVRKITGIGTGPNIIEPRT